MLFTPKQVYLLLSLIGDVVVDIQELKQFESVYQPSKEIAFCWGCGSLYSRDTICFVPLEINAFLTNKKAVDGDYPIGVLFHKASGKLISQITINGKKKYLGLFDNSLDAFYAYKSEKENQARHLAEKYKDVVDDRVYAKLLSYEVNIDD